MRINKFPFHPFIFAPYPALALAASNLNWVSAKLSWSLAATYLMMFIILMLCWLGLKDFHKAAAITSLFVFFFFTYGHVYNLLAKGSNPALWLAALWLALFYVGVRWIRSWTGAPRRITLVLNWISIILLLFPLVTIGVEFLRDQVKESEGKPAFVLPTIENSLTAENIEALPDIYFIILDGYARADILSEIYGYDNQPTLDFLRDHGFYVADESHANYHHTVLSLSTTLNMSYIKELLAEQGIESYDYRRILNHVHENLVFELTSQLGYELVVFDAGYTVTSIHQADHHVRPDVNQEDPSPQNNGGVLQYRLGLFETRYLETTALRPLLPYIFNQFPEDSRYQDRRQHTVSTFSKLPMFTQEKGPHFIFAYILTPHPPFVFNHAGETVHNWRPYTVSDGSHWVGLIGTRAEYIQGYREQIQFVNTLLKQAIEEILSTSNVPPIIVIQGDHGPGAYFEWQSINRTNLHERLSIINAIYLPDGDGGMLYPSITPINTFKVIFNRYFGGDFELSQDRAYFSRWGRPFEFTEITNQIR